VAPGQQLVPHPPPGAIVAEKYRVERVLGQGGMGVVLAAKHTVLDQRFALKFVLDLSDQEGIERFLREARATAKLETEHVCRVSDVGTHEGAPFIVMEMLSGMDLHARLTAYGPMPPTEAVDYVLQALDALSEAHARGIVHRDLKPSNLFLANRGDGTTIVKVLDFGISKVHDVETITSKPSAANANAKAIAASLTQTGTVMGSPPYMSPEQLASTRDVDARCDIWAMGTILYELLTGQRAFPAGSADLFQNILEGKHRPIRALRPDVPESLEAIIEKCLAVRREERWSSAAELSRALLAFAPSKGKLHVARAERWAGGVSAPPAPMTPRAAASTAPTGGIALATTKRVLTATPRWPVISTIALGALVLSLLFIATRLRHMGSAPPPPPPNVVAAEPAPVPVPTVALAPEPVVSAAPAKEPTTKDAGAPHKKPRKPKPGEPVDLGRL
jgi:serine/threonine-protein kinase